MGRQRSRSGAPPQPGFGGYPGQANPYAQGPATYSAIPTYGPGPAPQFGPGPAPRRRSPLLGLLLAMIAVVVVAMAALVITGLTAEQSDTAFQNDDFQVPPPDTNPPPIPIPQTEQEVVQWSEANAIYSQSMPAPVRCNAQPIDVQNSSEAVLESHFDDLMECLVRAWQPPVTNAGFIIIRPTVTIYGESITTKCGESGINAFCCSADQQIYYSRELPRIRTLEGKWAADVVMAHEYGHLLQGRTGLFAAGIIASKNAGSNEEGLIFRCWLETQADLLLRHLHPFGVEVTEHPAGRRRRHPQLLRGGRGRRRLPAIPTWSATTGCSGLAATGAVSG